MSIPPLAESIGRCRGNREPLMATSAFTGTDPAADLKTVYFRCREAESPTDAVQSVFQSMIECSPFSLGSAFDHRPNVPLQMYDVRRVRCDRPQTVRHWSPGCTS